MKGDAVRRDTSTSTVGTIMNIRWKCLLSTLALAFLLAFVLHVENDMIAQFRTLMYPQASLATSWSKDQMVDKVAVVTSNPSSLSSLSSSSSTTDSINQEQKDWFQEEAWHKNHFTKECWHVEDICHSSHRWFYDPRSQHRDRQPPFSLELYDVDLTTLRLATRYKNPKQSPFFLGRPKQMMVHAPLAFNGSSLTATTTTGPPDEEDYTSPSFLQTCQYSPIPNHVVLQSYYNDMLGEFYTRTLTHLYKFHNSVTQGAPSSDGTLPLDHVFADQVAGSTFPEQTQMYLHVRNLPEHNKLLDSHHVFTDAFRSNPMLSFTYLLDYTGCRCMKRLFLCGYDAVREDSRDRRRGVFTNISVTTKLQAAGVAGPEHLERDYPHVFRDLREHLLRSTVQQNPFLQQDIAKFRAKAIAQHRPTLVNLTRQDIQEFRIVGLTQRKGRRKWLDLPDIIRRCNTEWFDETDKIVCIEVNLENDDVNPVRQIVIHAACNMMFGIHGAQLTEAIWMKNGSVVVELLPWIPGINSFGSWTRTTEKPTPLGVIFSECHINHIGYPLQRDSAPYCLDKTDPADLKRCFSRFMWDSRDFKVSADVIHDMIRKFAPRLSSNSAEKIAIPSTCHELQQRAGDQVYVLYNVLCSNQTKSNNSNNAATLEEVHHFYWPKGWNWTNFKTTVENKTTTKGK